MAVQLVDKNLKVTKEMSEIYDALVALVMSAKGAKEAGLTGASLGLKVAGDGLQPLMVAVDGLSGLSGEAHDALPAFLKTQGVGAGELAEAIALLLQAKAPAPAPAV